MLAPGEERTVYFDVKAPQDPWFRFNPSGEVVLVEAASGSNPQAKYTLGVPVPISGFFLPGWVIPHIALFLIGLVAMVRQAAPRVKERRLEKGKPEYPGLPPEEHAVLVALKKTDPARSDLMEQRLKKLHKRRREAWKDRYAKRKELEKRMLARERARHDAYLEAQREKEREEALEEKRRLKELRRQKRKRRKELKKLRRRKRKAEKRREKARKREEKALAKELKRKQKAKEKKLEKLKKAKEKRRKELREQKEKALEAKRKRLEKLKKQKEKAEKADDSSSWLPWK
ncbi:MAG: hypothetical protein R3185_08155, partial [Candidatus Thermoplasmatota archaeon]|nr:hypothetical protein [Candidatus Thermoplasmatota archaeon]